MSLPGEIPSNLPVLAWRQPKRFADNSYQYTAFSELYRAQLIAAYQHSLINPGNPHGTTAEMVGAEPALGNPVGANYVLSSSTAGARSWVPFTSIVPGPHTHAIGEITGLLAILNDLTDRLSALERGDVYILSVDGTVRYAVRFTPTGASTVALTWSQALPLPI